MHKLRRFYYDNKYKIWGVIVAIVLLLLAIQIMNKIVENNINISNKNNEPERNIINDINSGDKNTSVTTDKSIISGEQVDSNELEEVSKVIEEFISYCNNGNLEQAYNLLTEDCKQELYPNLNQFKTLYYDKIFSENIKKVATIENWMLDTYVVTISNDIMATGGISSNAVQDYITVEEYDDVLKLSINNFIEKEEINKKEIIDNIEFEIIEKKVYTDNEVYTIKATNNTENNIILADLTNTKSIYFENNNGVKYYPQTSEMIENLLNVNKGFSTQFDMKIIKDYDTPNIISITFSQVDLNNSETQEKSKIIIDL